MPGPVLSGGAGPCRAEGDATPSALGLRHGQVRAPTWLRVGSPECRRQPGPPRTRIGQVARPASLAVRVPRSGAAQCAVVAGGRVSHAVWAPSLQARDRVIPSTTRGKELRGARSGAHRGRQRVHAHRSPGSPQCQVFWKRAYFPDPSAGRVAWGRGHVPPGRGSGHRRPGRPRLCWRSPRCSPGGRPSVRVAGARPAPGGDLPAQQVCGARGTRGPGWAGVRPRQGPP